MFDRDRALELLDDAIRKLDAAQQALATIKKEGGEVVDLRPKRRAVQGQLDELATGLDELNRLVAAATADPAGSEEAGEAEPPADPHGSDEGDADEADASGTPGDPIEPDAPEPEPPTALVPLEDQHAVSKLMQDSAVHLAVKRAQNFWEIRHRNTANGQASDPLRAETIAEAYELYEASVVRKGSPPLFEPRPLTDDEQQALIDFREIRVDNPRSIRWEATKTEVDYLDRDGGHAGGSKDTIEFPPGELIGPVEHLKRVLG